MFVSVMGFSPRFSVTDTLFHSYFAVKEVSEQNRELLRQALEEAHDELSKKFQIIKEIRAVESLPHNRIRNFDDTEVSRRVDGSEHTYFLMPRVLRLTGCPMTDCRTWSVRRDVPVRAEGATGSPEGGAAKGAAGETGENLKGEAEE